MIFINMIFALSRIFNEKTGFFFNKKLVLLKVRIIIDVK